MSDQPIVYEHPLSPYAQKVKLALREKSVPFSVVTGFGSDEARANFIELSPRAEVPVLVHGTQVLYESSVILAYIEDRWPEPALLPATPADQARSRLIQHRMDTEFEANTWGLAEISIFGRATGDLATALIDYGTQEIRRWFQWLEIRLDGLPWFGGEDFGYADICVVPFVNGAGRFAIHPEPASPLGSWLQRVNQRDSVTQTQAEAAAAELDPATMQAALDAGFQREYRDYRLEWMIRAGGLRVVEAGLAANNIRFNAAPNSGG